MQAMWLLEIALGNLLVVVITEIQVAVQGGGDDHGSGGIGAVTQLNTNKLSHVHLGPCINTWGLELSLNIRHSS